MNCKPREGTRAAKSFEINHFDLVSASALTSLYAKERAPRATASCKAHGKTGGKNPSGRIARGESIVRLRHMCAPFNFLYRAIAVYGYVVTVLAAGRHFHLMIGRGTIFARDALHKKDRLAFVRAERYGDLAYDAEICRNCRPSSPRARSRCSARPRRVCCACRNHEGSFRGCLSRAGRLWAIGARICRRQLKSAAKCAARTCL